MKSLFNLLIIAGVFYFGFSTLTKPYKPCDTPVSYKIGTIDPRFKLSQKELLDHTNESSRNSEVPEEPHRKYQKMESREREKM